MQYQEAMEYLSACARYGSVPGLKTIRELLRRLSNPQEGLTYVHIAGTNGKGSTLCLLSAALTAAGYKTGSFSSPVVYDEREQWRINGKPIAKREVGSIMEEVAAAADQMEAEGLAHPTVFEVQTAFAFLYFSRKKCDIVVLETGMGGTLDATNVIPAPKVAVITPIGRDHMAWLGDSLMEIAAHKAGIIKPGCTVVTLPQRPEVMRVLREACEERDCPMVLADPAEAGAVKYGLDRQSFSWRDMKHIELGLSGKYQIDNAVLTLNVLKVLEDKGYPVREEKLRAAFSEASWPGRFEVLQKKPLFVADGAHNEDGVRRLCESADFYFTNRKRIYIMGMLSDKEAEKIIAMACPAAAAVITVAAPGNSRAVPALMLAGLVRKVCPNVTAADSVEEAVEMALLMAGKEDVILALGSLSFQGRLREALLSDPAGFKKRHAKATL